MRIGEAAAAVGLTTKTIRFYEDRGLLPLQLTDLDRQIAKITALRAAVARYHAAAEAADPESCDPKRICSYL